MFSVIPDFSLVIRTLEGKQTVSNFFALPKKKQNARVTDFTELSRVNKRDSLTRQCLGEESRL